MEDKAARSIRAEGFNMPEEVGNHFDGPKFNLRNLHNNSSLRPAMAELHIPTAPEYRRMPEMAVRRMVDTHLYPAETGLRRTSTPLRDDVTVTISYINSRGAHVVDTVRGMEAVRQHRLHQHERSYTVHEHKPGETTADIAAYREALIRRGA